MSFESLLATDAPEDRKAPKLVQITKAPSKAAVKKLQERGCSYCPQNKAKGIKKVFGKVHGDRKLFIFGMAPGPNENEEGKEFVGKSGKLLWDEFKKVGITRKDVEIQNSVRCFPADRINGRLVMRDPSKEEINCCSVYNEKAIAKSDAKVYVILGVLAQKVILGKEYKKSRKIFYSEKLKAKVYCLYHPS